MSRRDSLRLFFFGNGRSSCRLSSDDVSYETRDLPPVDFSSTAPPRCHPTPRLRLDTTLLHGSASFTDSSSTRRPSISAQPLSSTTGSTGRTDRTRFQAKPGFISGMVLKTTVAMDQVRNRRGCAWAASAGFNAALAAVAAKFISCHIAKYTMVVLFNVMMWACYVNSLRAMSSLQATVTNFATNFLSSGLAGFFLFEETLSAQWFAGAGLIVIGCSYSASRVWNQRKLRNRSSFL